MTRILFKGFVFFIYGRRKLQIMIFLRTTLGDTAFREVLMFHPEAADEFIEYLKAVQEFEQLNTIYL